MIGIATSLSLISAKVILIPNRSNDSLIGKEVTVNFPPHTAAPRVYSRLSMLFSWTPSTKKEICLNKLFGLVINI